MTIRVLDPSHESNPEVLKQAPRLKSLEGKIVGFISNGKEGTGGFFAHLDNLLRQRYNVADVIFRTKSNYSAPAEQDIIDEAKKWDLAITGLGD